MVVKKSKQVPQRQRFVGLIDVVIIFLVLVAILIYQKPLLVFKFISKINSPVLYIAALIIYRLICLLIFNVTIGMTILRVRLLNGELKKLTIKERILAAFFVLYKGVSYYNKRVKD